MLRVGIIGAGGIADMHARGVMDEPGALELAAVCDADMDRAEAFGKRYGVAAISQDYREMLEAPGIDAVIVILPHFLHEQVCTEALAAGKHVLVEKPIARTLGEADRMIAAAEAAGKTLMVAHNQRFFPIHRQIRELLDANGLGDVFCAHVDHYQNFNPPPGSWWRSKEAVGGGCVIGSGIHRLDLLRWYLGEVDEVSAHQVYEAQRLEAEVACTATLKFRDGAIGEFLCNWGIHSHPYGESLSLTGKQGAVYARSWESHYLLSRKQADDGKMAQIEAEDRFDSMWLHFAKCVASGSVPLTSGPDGRQSLALVLAVNQAAESGRPVKITVSPAPTGADL